MQKIKKHWIWAIFILVCVLIGSVIVSLSIGSAGIPVQKILHILLNEKGSVEYNIIVGLRLPRILLGMAVGGSLSLAGTILQGIFRNPLVEPYTLGISDGASLGVCFNIIAVLGVIAYPVSGFMGAMLVILLVYSLSLRTGALKTNGMLLIGVMVSFISSSVVMLLMAISRSEDMQSIVFWVMGSLDEPNLTLIKTAVMGSLIGLILSYFFCRDLNALGMGEEEAIHVGVNIEKTKRILFVLASLLTGLSVSVSGIIMFVGLIVPHFIRMTVGSDHRILLLGSFLAGAVMS